MIYVTSDLHGYPLEKYKKLLDNAKFSQDDFLYLLGDVIDRNGDGGVAMLCWLLEQPNIEDTWENSSQNRPGHFELPS